MGNQEIKGSLGQGQGYRVISVAENSPCYNARIQFFTDFIVDIEPVNSNNESLQQDQQELELNGDGQYVVDEKKDFFAIVNENENKPLNMVIYDTLQRNIRKIQIVPNKQWSSQQNLLGVMLRLENYLASHDNTFKVLTVDENSPAQKAGLVAKYDYIIGLKKYKYEGLDELINIIFDNEGQEIELIVFNTQEKRVKNAILKPQANWGGRGLIGCEFAGGYLNQLPVILDEAAEQAKKQLEQERQQQLMETRNEQLQQQQKIIVISSDPPPTDIQVNENTNSDLNKKQIVPHQHHQIQQQRKQHRKHSRENDEIKHITDPFSIQRKISNSQNTEDLNKLSQPNDDVNQSRNISSDPTKQEIIIQQSNVQSQQSLSQYGNQTNSTAFTTSSDNTIPTQPSNKINENSSNLQENRLQSELSAQAQTQLQPQYNAPSNQNVNQSRKDSAFGNKKYEYECPNLQPPQKYVIIEKDLFNLKVKLQANNLLFQHEYKISQ